METNCEQILRLMTVLNEILKISLGVTQPVLKEFVSEKTNNKLIQQLQDPLVLASRSLPYWCKHLLNSYKFLFPFETRQLYFTTTAFGVSRSIVWLQNKRDTLLSNLRGPSSQRVASGVRDDHEYRIGRLKHERVKIPREPSESLMRAAINALKFHATRKAILEIEFIDEEGTGLGPTLEFFSLIAAELQRKKLALWYCDFHNNADSDAFVHEKNGLFPAAYPVGTTNDHFESVLEYFNFMGIFIAKSLQDQRLVDIPFSHPFLKLVTSYKETTSDRDDDEHDDDSDSSGETNNHQIDIDGILDLDDLILIDPYRGNLLKQLKIELERGKLTNENSSDQNDDDNSSVVDDIIIEINQHKVNLDDLG